MRTCPRNSPQAAARILALAMLADGHQCNSELAVLERLDAHEPPGLLHPELHAVVHAFCEDLLAVSVGICWADICLMHPGLLRQVLDEVDDPALQLKVISLCILLVKADQHLADNESRLIAAAIQHWGLHRYVQQTALTTGEARQHGS